MSEYTVVLSNKLSQGVVGTMPRKWNTRSNASFCCCGARPRTPLDAGGGGCRRCLCHGLLVFVPDDVDLNNDDKAAPEAMELTHSCPYTVVGDTLKKARQRELLLVVAAGIVFVFVLTVGLFHKVVCVAYYSYS